MHKNLAVLFGAFGLFSCVSNDIPPEPTTVMATRSGVSIEVLQRGHGVYMLKCGECHEPMMPADISESDWHVVVPGMAWNAGISTADEDALTKYILAARPNGDPSR